MIGAVGTSVHFRWAIAQPDGLPGNVAFGTTMQSRQRNLNAAAPISEATTIRDRLSARNRSDLFSFSLTNASKLNLQFRSSGQGASLQLIQDRNQNGLIDAGETIRSERMRPQRGRDRSQSRGRNLFSASVHDGTRHE
ncbi:MAG: hypothetical protein HC895_17390 [Leptolyngbyaceae cyanobacterium SM1_3_5]|nr:hypothetical protein [Leptolyngbyaceae cyanobacterium SM1_3_5]